MLFPVLRARVKLQARSDGGADVRAAWHGGGRKERSATVLLPADGFGTVRSAAPSLAFRGVIVGGMTGEERVRAEPWYPRYTEYTLDRDRVYKLPIAEALRDRTDDGCPPVLVEMLTRLQGQKVVYGPQASTTVGAAIKELSSEQIDSDFVAFGEHLVVKTASHEIQFEGSRFSIKLLEHLLRLQKAGVNPWFCSWFFYDSESGGIDSCYHFFVVGSDDNDDDGRIVLENATLLEHAFPESRLDGSLFVASDRPDPNAPPIWSGEEGRRQARVLFWYRKFLKETVTGQLIALHPDVDPELLDFLSRPLPTDTSTAASLDPAALSLLRQGFHEIRVLLWILVALGVLVLIRLWM